MRGRSPGSAALAEAGQTTSRPSNSAARVPLTSLDDISLAIVAADVPRHFADWRYDSDREADAPSEERNSPVGRAGHGRAARGRRQDEGVARAQRPVRRRRRRSAALARHPRARLPARRRSPDPLAVSPRVGVPAPGGGRARHAADQAPPRQGKLARLGVDRSWTARHRAPRRDPQQDRRRGGPAGSYGRRGRRPRQAPEGHAARRRRAAGFAARLALPRRRLAPRSLSRSPRPGGWRLESEPGER